MDIETEQRERGRSVHTFPSSSFPTWMSRDLTKGKSRRSSFRRREVSGKGIERDFNSLKSFRREVFVCESERRSLAVSHSMTKERLLLKEELLIDCRCCIEYCIKRWSSNESNRSMETIRKNSIFYGFPLHTIHKDSLHHHYCAVEAVEEGRLC